jgi:hypothetical protein
MKRPAKLLLAACLVNMVVGSAFAAAAEGVAVEQDLPAVKASSLVTSAAWKRQADSYTLQLGLDRLKYLGFVNLSDALKSMPPTTSTRTQPVPIPNWRPNWQSDLAAQSLERASNFIAETIANLRRLDPTFGSRTLGVEDVGDHRVEAWLLKADGSVIQPSARTSEVAGTAAPARNDISISFTYSAAEAAQAVAIAIKIDNDFYIEKLQPLAAPAVQ